MGNYETLITEIKEKILHLTINRPEKLNALSEQVLSELKNLLSGIKNDKNFTVKGVIVTGSGDKAFIAGADIKAMDAMTPAQGESFGRLGQEVSVLFEEIPIPVVACVNGFALGGGCEMAMSCDFIYATPHAVFGQPEINLGLIPGFGGTQRLARFVGMGHAKELIYTGRNIKADEALELGLVQKIFSNKDEMITAAEKTLGIIREKSAFVVAKCKESIVNGYPLAKGLAVESSSFRSVFESEDKQIGVKAFLKKKTPSFKT